MENGARPPPGTGAQSAAWWKPFDVKGIRLYAHERRYEAAFGAGGLRIGGARHEAMRAALTADVAMLREWALVDYSFLISVFPLPGARPEPCERLGRRSDYHTRRRRQRGGESGGAGTLLAAMYQLPNAQGGPGGMNAVEAAATAGVPLAGASARGMPLCVAVVAKLGVIDYLREFRMGEAFEHVQKSLRRDLFAGERNHAVVPVRQFGERFSAFFSGALFTPIAPPERPAAAAAATRLARRVVAVLGTACCEVRRGSDARTVARDALASLSTLVTSFSSEIDAPRDAVERSLRKCVALASGAVQRVVGAFGAVVSLSRAASWGERMAEAAASRVPPHAA